MRTSETGGGVQPLFERRPRVAEVAARAGVSTATVDRVINARGGVRKKTVALVEKAIRGVPGVLAVEVRYQKGEAVIGTESCCPMPRDAILKALQSAGYRGTFVGADAEGAWREVRRSNLAKINPDTGKVNKREDGKVLKPEGWTPPNLKPYLERK